MPTRAELVPLMAHQLEASIAVLPIDAAIFAVAAQDPLYFHRLALFHEDMHAEAFCWMRSALEYPAPAGVTVPRLPPSEPLNVPSADTRIGWPPTQPGFAFDNQCPAMDV